jgi:hypothetical protein
MTDSESFPSNLLCFSTLPGPRSYFGCQPLSPELAVEERYARTPTRTTTCGCRRWRKKPQPPQPVSWKPVQRCSFSPHSRRCRCDPRWLGSLIHLIQASLAGHVIHRVAWAASLKWTANFLTLTSPSKLCSLPTVLCSLHRLLILPANPQHRSSCIRYSSGPDSSHSVQVTCQSTCSRSFH